MHAQTRLDTHTHTHTYLLFGSDRKSIRRQADAASKPSCSPFTGSVLLVSFRSQSERSKYRSVFGSEL